MFIIQTDTTGEKDFTDIYGCGCCYSRDGVNRGNQELEVKAVFASWVLGLRSCITMSGTILN
jgi:hypothetical protein